MKLLNNILKILKNSNKICNMISTKRKKFWLIESKIQESMLCKFNIVALVVAGLDLEKKETHGLKIK